LNRLKQRTAEEIKLEPDPEVRRQWEELQKASPFCRLDTCAGLVTLGSNMPMFTFTFGPTNVFPVTAAPHDDAGNPLHPAFPGVALPPALKDKTRWLNFYSELDILGFPLKSINDYYRDAAAIRDIRVWSGAPWFIPYVWCIFAHTRYWTNRVVIKHTLDLIRDMAETPE
jgi:hypothetical protein